MIRERERIVIRERERKRECVLLRNLHGTMNLTEIIKANRASLYYL